MSKLKKAKDKAIAIINSCKKVEHIESAEKFIHLFYDNYKDSTSSVYLTELLKGKRIEISNIHNK